MGFADDYKRDRQIGYLQQRLQVAESRVQELERHLNAASEVLDAWSRLRDVLDRHAPSRSTDG